MDRLIDYKSLLRSAPDLYLILTPDFRIIDGSDAYLKATRIKREEVIGRSVFEVFPENTNDANAIAVQNFRGSLETVVKTKAANTMAVQKYDIKRPTNEGGGLEEHYWSPINYPLLNDKNEIVCIFHRVSDVTEFIRLKQSDSEKQKLTEDLRTRTSQFEREIYQRAQEIDNANRELRFANEQLAQTEYMSSKLAAIVEFSEDAIIGLTLDGIIESWNKGAERLYGYTAEEMEGHSAEKLFSLDRRPEYTFIVEQIKSNIPLSYMETERMHKDGRAIPVSVTISPLKDKMGNVLGACSIARDITAWKEIEKMKNEFISIVSHELRTPLTSIQGSLALLVAGAAGDLPERAQKLLKIGKQNSERLIRLINDILDIEKIESGQMEFKLQSLNIGLLVNEAVSTNQAYADKFDIKITGSSGFSMGVAPDDHNKTISLSDNFQNCEIPSQRI